MNPNCATKPGTTPPFLLIVDDKKPDVYFMVTYPNPKYPSGVGRVQEFREISANGDSKPVEPFVCPQFYLEGYNEKVQAEYGEFGLSIITDAEFTDRVELPVIQEIFGLFNPNFDDTSMPGEA